MCMQSGLKKKYQVHNQTNQNVNWIKSHSIMRSESSLCLPYGYLITYVFICVEFLQL